VARDLAAQLKRLDGPHRIHAEGTARLLSAIRAVATPDMHGVTANAVANRAAETSAGAYSCLHARRGYANAAMGECCEMTPAPVKRQLGVIRASGVPDDLPQMAIRVPEVA
jgi:hypothetical protein